jgi:hypothetical protein
MTAKTGVVDALAGARLKIEGAKTHLEAIEEEIARVIDPDAYRVVGEFQDERRKYAFRVEGLRELDPMLSTVIGDCLHNLRSAFDHIAYQLILAVDPPLEPTTSTMFPLLAEEPEKPVYISPKSGPGARTMEIVEGVQAYHRGVEHDPLAILEDLNRVGKHRELPPVVTAIDFMSYALTNEMRSGGAASPDPVVDGEEFAWILFREPYPDARDLCEL